MTIRGNLAILNVMPIRKFPLVNGEVFHIYNRSVGPIPIFTDKKEHERFIFGLVFYQNDCVPIKLSKFNKLSKVKREKIIHSLREKKEWLVEIVSYCVMPTHFHLVLRQLKENGIENYVRLVTNSFSHYFNIKNDRSGSLFADRFKAVHIENDEQLLHVVRYVHLNPFTSYIVRNLEELEDYSFSSLPEYLGKSTMAICQKQLILDFFPTTEKYRNFVLNQADFQRSLHKIKHKIFE